ncbi:MAG TPA: ABC transporter substrate-binding protein [Acidimicrobiales bacterium]|nr:ABC transporter substrate-binding protein [Acidimicrobiales bacterium]
MLPWSRRALRDAPRDGSRSSPRRGARRAGRSFAVGVAALATGAVLPGLAAATSARAGWVIAIASPRSSTPSFAYPFASGDELTPANVHDFQQLAFRPLYFFGGARTVQLNEPLSLATRPVYGKGDTSVSFTIKPGLRWSDGELVSAQGVVEWLNLLAAYPGMWGDYLAPTPTGVPLGIPDDVRAVAVSGNTVTMTLAGPVNPTWFTDSELSQITPLPASWDRYEPSHPHVPATGPLSISGNLGRFTGPTANAGCYSTHWIGDGNLGPGAAFVDPLGTRTVVQAADVPQAQRCVDAVQLFRSMAFDTADYATAGTDVAAAFGLSDGPWRLLTYHRATGGYTFAPNRAAGASGQHPAATLLSFVPCAGTASCEGLLARGVVDQGALPLADAPRVSSLAAGPSRNPLRAAGYREQVVAPWATTFMPYNFASTSGAAGHAGRVFAQRYFRLAFQSLVDQPAIIGQALSGYGVVTTAPIPTDPSSAFSTAVANPAPFNVAHAAALLASHGWHLAPGRRTTCSVPAKCGVGIPRGTPLAFSIVYAPSPGLTRSIALLVHDAKKVGIVLTATSAPPASVLADVGSASPTWDLASWDGGWQYEPDYFPSGEWLFAAGSPWNVGGYADAHATALVAATLRLPSELAAYDAYLALQLPVVWLPTPVTLLETRATLHDVAASPIGSLTPEAWRR